MEKSRKLWTIQESTKPEDRLRSAAAGLAAGALPAQAADVVSSNIVGYQKIELANGFNMIGTAFQNVGVANQINIQDIKASGLTGLDWTFATTAGDTLLIWDSSAQGYLTTLYYTGDEDTDGLMAGMGATPGTWFDTVAFGTATDTLENGDAFWILSSSPNATVTIAGEVPEDANSITIVPGFNMIANPYPKAVKVNDLFTCTGLTGLDWTFATTAGDTLMIWNPEEQGYTTSLYYAGDSDPDGIMAGFGAEPGTWFDTVEFKTAETEIPVGGAFWILSSGTGTLTFK